MERRKVLYLRINHFSFWIAKSSESSLQGSFDHPKGGYVCGLWEDVFLSCEESTGKLLVGHLLRNGSRLEEDMLEQ